MSFSRIKQPARASWKLFDRIVIYLSILLIGFKKTSSDETFPCSYVAGTFFMKNVPDSFFVPFALFGSNWNILVVIFVFSNNEDLQMQITPYKKH